MQDRDLFAFVAEHQGEAAKMAAPLIIARSADKSSRSQFCVRRSRLRFETCLALNLV